MTITRGHQVFELTWKELRDAGKEYESTAWIGYVDSFLQRDINGNSELGDEYNLTDDEVRKAGEKALEILLDDYERIDEAVAFAVDSVIKERPPKANYFDEETVQRLVDWVWNDIYTSGIFADIRMTRSEADKKKCLFNELAATGFLSIRQVAESLGKTFEGSPFEKMADDIGWTNSNFGVLISQSFYLENGYPDEKHCRFAFTTPELRLSAKKEG